MEITVLFNGLETSDAIRKYVESKIGKLSKYFDETATAQITLTVEKLNHTIKVNLNTHGYIVHVEESDANLYSAIDLVSDTLERKIKKYSEKLKSKKNKNARKGKDVRSFVAKEEILSFSPSEKAAKDVIKVKNYDIKLMDTEEAAMQMDLLNKDFLVFINDESDAVSVIYKRKDGNYGLIEAKAR